MARITPPGAFRFNVEIDGLVVAHFQGVSGMSSEHEVVAHVEGGRNHATVKLPGQRQYGEITLKRGYTFGHTLQDWADLVSRLGNGRSVRKSLSVIMLDNDCRTELGRYQIEGAWPRKWEVAELTGESQIAVESVELAHEGLRFEPSGGGGGGRGDVAQRAAAAARAARAVRRASEAVRAAAEAADQARAGGAAAAVGAGVAAGAAAAMGVGAAGGAGGAAAAAAAASGALDDAAAGRGPSGLEGGWSAANGPGGGDPAAAIEAALAGGAVADVGPLASGGDAGPEDARAFARGAAADAGPPWSDGVDAVQPAAGFGEPGLPGGSGGGR